VHFAPASVWTLSKIRKSATGAPGSWKALAVVHAGPSAYSALAIRNGSGPTGAAGAAGSLGRGAGREVLVLYEAGVDSPDPCQGKDPCWQQLTRIPLPP